jgi:hypothetical protein
MSGAGHGADKTAVVRHTRIKIEGTYTSRTTSGSRSCRSSSPFSSWQHTSPSRVCRAHFAGSGVCTEGPEESIAHTGGLFLVRVPLAVVRGSRTEAGASDDIEKKGREVEGSAPISHAQF